MSERKELNYDLVILGGGPAGLSAAIYAARGSLKTAVIDKSSLGGQVSNTLEIENYPGFSAIGGFELMEKFEEHADRFKTDKYDFQEIVNIDLKSKIIETHEYIFKAKSIIIATGAKPTKLNVQGEDELAGRGVSYCAVCYGAFFKEKDVCVVGGGNAAIEEAIYLTRFANSVTIIHRRDCLRADQLYQDRAYSNPKIKFVFHSVVKEIKGENKVESLLLSNVKTGETSEIATDGIFIYIGYSPNSELFTGQLQFDSNGFIITDTKMSVGIEGVFAAGDVRNTPLRQVITSASDGAISATGAIKYLEEIEAEHTPINRTVEC